MYIRKHFPIPLNPTLIICHSTTPPLQPPRETECDFYNSFQRDLRQLFSPFGCNSSRSTYKIIEAMSLLPLSIKNTKPAEHSKRTLPLPRNYIPPRAATRDSTKWNYYSEFFKFARNDTLKFNTLLYKFTLIYPALVKLSSALYTFPLVDFDRSTATECHVGKKHLIFTFWRF